MADRINEDIRFYLPADPYYYQVDNLPLEDLLTNDVRLQNQIDEIKASNTGNTVTRNGIRELQPFIDDALPGTVSVRSGNFIGRTQRTSGPNILGTNVKGVKDGSFEMNEPPTLDDKYSVDNPPNKADQGPADGVARNSVFNFPGGNIVIDGFNFDDFGIGETSLTTPPLARLDLVGITTVNGAMDDPYVPGNETGGVDTGNGTPRLAVVKGAGMIGGNSDVREVQIGERFLTVGQPQELLNDYGRDIDGNVVPNPEFGTVPMPDDVVNICMSQPDVQAELNNFAEINRNSSFFLPLAYVLVPQSHVEGNPIAEGYLHDIRPFFRTAELTLAERQAVANSLNPSVRNPFTTVSHVDSLINPVTSDFEQRLLNIENSLRGSQGTNLVFLPQQRLVFNDKSIQTIDPGQYGVPADAVGVYLYCWVTADTGGSPQGYLTGGAGRVRVVMAGPGGEGSRGAEDRNDNSVLLPLRSDGTFRAETANLGDRTNSNEYMRVYIRGYFTSLTFPGI